MANGDKTVTLVIRYADNQTPGGFIENQVLAADILDALYLYGFTVKTDEIIVRDKR